MIYADHALACRLENLLRSEYRRLAGVTRTAFPNVAVERMEAGGGVALWLGEGSPVNTAVGLGMGVPVEDGELERLESFYHDRGAPARISLCPLADASLLHGVGRRGWQAAGFEHVLVVGLEKHASGDAEVARGAPLGLPGLASIYAADPIVNADLALPGVEIRVCMPEERALWGRTAAQGFSDDRSPEPAEQDFGRIMAERDDAILVMAWVDGRPAGTGALVIDGGVGWLSGDSTLPRYRRQGVQQAIQRHRLQLARDAGCDLGVTEAEPGGQSQRNMERLGFRIVYTHVEFVKLS